MAIPGHPPKTTYAEIAFEDFGILTCPSQEGCRKKLGWRAHHHGRVDNAGVLHWKQVRARATRRGMRNLLKFVAMAYHSEWQVEPAWMRLYLTNQWAWREAARRYHYRIRAEWSLADRKEALRLARRSRKKPMLRKDYRNFYMWLYQAGLIPPRGV